MKSIDSFITKWNNVNNRKNNLVNQRVDGSHPLDIYIGHNSHNQKELILVSVCEPEHLYKSKSINIEVRIRNDNNWAIIFTLIKDDQESLFINLSYDLIISSRYQSNNKQGISFFIDRFLKWQQLLESGKNGLLSGSILKGLIGELLFLEQSIYSGANLGLLVEGWVGINKADRDFILPEKWYEIKCVDPSAVSVHISSVEQLDIIETGELVIYFVERSVDSEKYSFNLNELIFRVRDLLSDDLESLRKFNEKILVFGYIERNEYNDNYYICRNTKKYLVDISFPRIKKDQLPAAICKLSYELTIGSLARWEI
ncbi:PD-(D/E)XK motif protein [Paenibacillus sp. GP183]|uniref:PD-(D/E)XK motif protein n=1 Tax=Paenibacillus sp. GP183 TaxID=1882751 RepID=UPI0014955358|nr:PD-(D/E)XK motif protein [Paenibacillus sp. GP183]